MQCVCMHICTSVIYYCYPHPGDNNWVGAFRWYADCQCRVTASSTDFTDPNSQVKFDTNVSESSGVIWRRIDSVNISESFINKKREKLSHKKVKGKIRRDELQGWKAGESFFRISIFFRAWICIS